MLALGPLSFSLN